MTSAVEKVEIKLDHQIRGKDWYMIDRTRKSRAFEIRYYEEDIISYDSLLNLFFDIHDPTTLNSQGPDFGTQYRSAIFYQDDFQKLSSENKIKELNRSRFNNNIVTSLEYSDDFWIAEEYHQKYLKKKKFNFFSK